MPQGGGRPFSPYIAAAKGLAEVILKSFALAFACFLLLRIGQLLESERPAVLDRFRWIIKSVTHSHPLRDRHLRNVGSFPRQKKSSSASFEVKTSGKIGFYCDLAELKRRMQTAQPVPVHYGPSLDWGRQSVRTYRPATDDDDTLPSDPRHWTRDHVAQWLDYVTEQHGLPKIPASRFLMNGKALCLMSPNMFLSRVPLGGKLLYKDFQLRLCSAMYSALS